MAEKADSYQVFYIKETAAYKHFPSVEFEVPADIPLGNLVADSTFNPMFGERPHWPGTQFAGSYTGGDAYLSADFTAERMRDDGNSVIIFDSNMTEQSRSLYLGFLSKAISEKRFGAKPLDSQS